MDLEEEEKKTYPQNYKYSHNCVLQCDSGRLTLPPWTDWCSNSFKKACLESEGADSFMLEKASNTSNACNVWQFVVLGQ